MNTNTKTQTQTLLMEPFKGPKTAPWGKHSIETPEYAEHLRVLYQAAVVPDQGCPKGPVTGRAPAALAGDLEDAMAFMGAIPDSTFFEENGWVTITSLGYYAHGF